MPKLKIYRDSSSFRIVIFVFLRFIKKQSDMNIISKLFVVSVVMLSVCCELNGQTEKRLALVIGNATYEDAPLNNPEHDAIDISNKIKQLGFEVTVLTNSNMEDMEKAVSDISEKAKKYDVIFLYYSGHGLQVEGANYLVPIGAKLYSEADVRHKCVALNYILDKLDDSKCPMKIIVLDACRSNPFLRVWYKGNNGGGLSSVNPPKGTYITFATAPGAYALDGTGRNSPYAAAFLSTLDIPNLSLYDFFDKVNKEVLQSTNGSQDPWTNHSTLNGNFIFNNNSSSQQANQTTISTTTPTSDENKHKTCGTAKDYDGNTYTTIQIGTQCWMAENLRSTHYSNGKAVQAGGYSSYDNPIFYYPNDLDVKLRTRTYGLLYNWCAAIGDGESSNNNPSGVRGICPDGWHLPSYSEWCQLINYVKNQKMYNCGGDPENIAKSLASTQGWMEYSVNCSPGNCKSENNSTGFNALPAGFIDDLNRVMESFEYSVYYWTATSNTQNDPGYPRYAFAHVVEINAWSTNIIYKKVGKKDYAFSVRCVRD